MSDQHLIGTEGNDVLIGAEGDDWLEGLGGSDMLEGGWGNDLIDAGAGTDWMSGGAGADTYLFNLGFGLDVISDWTWGHAEDRIEFGAGISLVDLEVGGNANSLSLALDLHNQIFIHSAFPQTSFIGTVAFAGGMQWDAATLERKITLSDDFLSGGAGADTLDGGLGNDSLSGGDGDDFLYGDAGNDFMWGGAGADTYFFGRRDGADVITGAELAEDRLVLGAGITLADVEAARAGDDLSLAIRGSGDRITVLGYFLSGNALPIEFADGATWDAAAIDRKVVAGDDFLQGTEAGETLDGGLGNDSLNGGEGDDFLYGDAGNDFLWGGAGADTYFFGFGDGQDTVVLPDNADALRFGASITLADVEVTQEGNDLALTLGGGERLSLLGWFAGPASQLAAIRFADGAAWDAAAIQRKVVASDDTLNGTSGSDTLDGGLGNDFIFGGDGDDFLYGGGGFDMLRGGLGSDTYFFGRGDGYVTIDHYESMLEGETLQFGGGILLTDVQVAPSQFNLTLTLEGSDDTVSVMGYPYPAPMLLQNIRFADGAAWDSDTLQRKMSATDDFLFGSAAADTLDGGLGNDSLNGGEGDDFLYGDAGDDFLWGGAGADTYYFARGDGTDVITGGALGEDRVQLGSGLALPDVALERIGDDLALTLGAGSDRLTVGGYFMPGSALASIGFADGASWDAAAIDRKLVASDDFLLGTESGETLDGGLGNDTLSGGGGNDFLYGGAGNDFLWGGAGTDTYFFGFGDGQDTIVSPDNADALRFGAGVTLADVTVTQEGADLALSLGGGHRMTVLGWFADPANQLAAIRFADGASWDAAAIARKVNASDDVLPGGAGSDTLDGGLGNDIVMGFDGDDFLYGDAGHDSMTGGNGDDVFYFGAASQTDVIVDAGTFFDTGFDVVRLGAELAQANVEFHLDFGGALRLAWPDQGAELVLAGFLQPGNAGLIDAIHFGQGAENHLVRGTGFDDVLSGSARFDIFLDDDGADLLQGGAGSDFYLRANGFGVDTIADVADASGGNHVHFATMLSEWLELGYEAGFLRIGAAQTGTALLRLSGFDSTDVFGGARAVETFSFGEGFELSYEQLLGRGFDIRGSDDPNGDLLEGTNIHDRLYGLGGNDTLHGHDGADTFDGGAGNDSLFGGRGSDSYHFGRLSGTDTVLELLADAGDVDTLVFGSDITPEDLLVTRDELGNLHIAIAGAPAALRFNAWFNPELPSHVERFEFQGGTVLSDATIEAMVNDAPVVANPIADQSAAEDAAFSFTVPANAFADPDPFDSVASYAATLADGSALPTWLSFDAGTRTFSGTPANGEVGTVAVRVTASDERGLSVSDVFDLTVTNTNDAPTLANPLADQSARDTVAFSFTVPAGTFADVDAGDVLTYSTGALPAWLSFDPLTRTFSGTPGAADIGMIDVEVRATDSASASAADIFRITIGAAPDQTLTGTAGSDTLTGGSGNDTINGLGGADIMTGNLGNDAYFVDNSGDQVNEAAGGGIDTVNSSITYTLGQNVENLTLTGTGNRNGTGNALDNVLTGNSGNNTLSGGAGNDTYYTGSGDSVNESIDAGDDTAYSSVSRTLWANVEALVLTGTSNLTGTGNSAANLIRGNTGGNTLQGQGGIDILEGGDGNDTLSDSSSNSLFNGGAGADSLTGGSARQLYIGGTGNDTISTGSGADVIAFNVGDGQDDVNASTGADNSLSLGGGIDYGTLAFSKAGNDLVLDVNAVDRVAFKNWYLSSTNRSVANLQVIQGNDAERFDFQALADAFDDARAADPGITSWALTNALLEAHLGSSDSEALGGDLAYRYARDGSLAGIGFAPAQQILGSAQFGTQAQALQDDAALQVGAIRLG